MAAILEAFRGAIDAPDMLVCRRGSSTRGPREPGERRVRELACDRGARRRLAPDALVLDIGSTTTDVMLIADGRVRARGRDDHGRLARDELVYTGVARTPVAAIADAVPFGGEWVSVMAEQFATAADLYRMTGELDPQFDQADTADGGARSREASMRRLAHMVGCDVRSRPRQTGNAWPLAVARAGRANPRACDACSQGHRPGRAGRRTRVSEFLAARLAARLDRAYVEFAALVGVPAGDQLAMNTCGPHCRRRAPAPHRMTADGNQGRRQPVDRRGGGPWTLAARRPLRLVVVPGGGDFATPSGCPGGGIRSATRRRITWRSSRCTCPP